MADYEIDYGVGRQLELFGIKSGYILFIFFVAAISILLLFILYLLGINMIVSICLTVISATVLFALIYFLNKKMGKGGIAKYVALHSIPSLIRVNRRIYQIIEK